MGFSEQGSNSRGKRAHQIVVVKPWEGYLTVRSRSRRSHAKSRCVLRIVRPGGAQARAMHVQGTWMKGRTDASMQEAAPGHTMEIAQTAAGGEMPFAACAN